MRPPKENEPPKAAEKDFDITVIVKEGSTPENYDIIFKFWIRQVHSPRTFNPPIK